MTVLTVPAPTVPTLSRRGLLQVGAALGGGLLVGFFAPTGAAETATGEFAPNAFIRIDRAGKVTLVMPQVEMGQGVYTSISMILAEELDAAWNEVTFQHAPPSDALYANPTFGLQATGNSNSIRAFWIPLRKAGAGTRAILVQAAAAGWNVDAASCRTEASEVIHDASGRRIGYGALTGRASMLKPPRRSPAEGSEKLPSDRQVAPPARHAGKGQRPDQVRHRCDAAGCEVRDAGQSPVFGGKIAHVG